MLELQKYDTVFLKTDAIIERRNRTVKNAFYPLGFKEVKKHVSHHKVLNSNKKYRSRDLNRYPMGTK